MIPAQATDPNRAAKLPQPAGPGQIRVFLLGRVRIEGPNGAIRLPTRKAESLLAYLILHPGSQTREKLTDLLWTDAPPKQARTSFRVALAAIRAQLGPDILESEHATVQVRPGYALWVDALEFHAQAARLLSGATGEPSDVDIDLYQGDLLADLYQDWIAPLREHYRGLYLNTLLRLGQLWRARSEYARAAECARQALGQDNLNEQAHRDLMLSLAAQGDRPAALKQYMACQRVLQDELGVEPAPAITALYDWIKRTAPGLEPQAGALTNLPIPLTSFVGRTRELAEVKRLFAATRLLTLTGVGGSGKTRLAIQLAATLAPGFRDGVWWVELDRVADPFLVPRLVAKALGVRDEPPQPLAEALAAHLRPRQALLVIDNCEHLVAACADLATTLMQTCPDLKILTTSREVLGVAGESAWRVPPLSLPDAQGWGAAGDLNEFESVRLFMERAAAARPDLRLSRDNAAAVVDVCCRLDGIPLALELAAARARVLSVEQIAQRLAERDLFGFLTGGSHGALPRQQTLQGAIEWSYQLLTENEQQLYRRLAVFVGGFSLEAAEQVAGLNGRAAHAGAGAADSGAGAADGAQGTADAKPDVLSGLSRLVDKSLIGVALAAGQARYRLLETIREFGLDKLRLAGETDDAHLRHFDWCAALAETAAPHLLGADQARWLDRLEGEIDNLRAALEWSLSGPSAAGMRLAAQLGQFWYVRGYFAEGRRWLERTLAAGAGPATAEQGEALYWQGFLAWMQADYAVARGLFEQSKTISEALGDRKGLARALQNEGLVWIRQGDYVTARGLLQRSLALQQQVGDQQGSLVSLFAAGRAAWFQNDLASAHGLLDRGLAIAQATGNVFLRSLALSSLGDVAWSEGNYPLAESRQAECLANFRKLGNRQNTATALLSLGYVALAQGQLAAAQSHYAESLVTYAQLGDKWGIANALQGFGCLAAAEGTPDRAARLLGAADNIRSALGTPVPIFQAAHDLYTTAARQALGAAAYASARAVGAGLAQERAIEYALIGALPEGF